MKKNLRLTNRGHASTNVTRLLLHRPYAVVNGERLMSPIADLRTAQQMSVVNFYFDKQVRE